MKENTNKLLMIFLILLFIVGGVCVIQLSNKEIQQQKVLRVDKVEKTSGDKDSFSTYVYYNVTTDKGFYIIDTKGINAAPQCVGLSVDSVYTLTTRGIGIPFFGIYSNIIDVE